MLEMETAYAERKLREYNANNFDEPYRAHNAAGFQASRYVRSAWSAISRAIGAREN